MSIKTTQELESGGQNPARTPNSPARPASFPRRLGALFYDLMAVAALWFGATAVLLALVTGGEAIPPGSLYYPLILAAVALAYFIVSWRRAGQTLGMRAWRLALVSDAGGRPGVGLLLVRTGMGLVSLSCLGLGFFWALGRADRRTWHDLASGTHLERR